MKIVFRKICFILLSSCIFFTSCRVPRTYFTQEIRDKITENKLPLREVQFYIDRDVELTREVDSAERAKVNENHRVEIRNGRAIEIISLPKYTPGIFKFASNNNNINIAFDINNENETLNFAVSNSGYYSSIYSITALEWLNSGATGRLLYENKDFFLTGTSTAARLMMKKQHSLDQKMKKRKLKGILLEGADKK